MNTDEAENIRFCVDNFDQNEISVRIIIKSGSELGVQKDDFKP